MNGKHSQADSGNYVAVMVSTLTKPELRIYRQYFAPSALTTEKMG